MVLGKEDGDIPSSGLLPHLCQLLRYNSNLTSVGSKLWSLGGFGFRLKDEITLYHTSNKGMYN